MISEFPCIPGIEFRNIVGLPGYVIGDDGSVWSPFLKGSPTLLSASWKEMSLYRRPYGARYVVTCFRIYIDGRPKVLCRYIHRLVLEAFVGPCPPGMECLHGDRDTSNNFLWNLRWGTKQANSADTVIHGTIRRKVRIEDVPEIRQMYDAGCSRTEIASRFGISGGQVYMIGSRKSWKTIPEAI